VVSIEVNSVLRLLHHVFVGHGVDVSEVHARFKCILMSFVYPYVFIYTNTHKPTDFDPEDGGSLYS
jgi:hypothetical protein